jgi:hypothetical protein
MVKVVMAKLKGFTTVTGSKSLAHIQRMFGGVVRYVNQNIL